MAQSAEKRKCLVYRWRLSLARDWSKNLQIPKQNTTAHFPRDRRLQPFRQRLWQYWTWVTSYLKKRLMKEQIKIGTDSQAAVAAMRVSGENHCL